MSEGRIKKVSGPLVVAEGLSQIKMYEVVKVGNLNLIGEVIELKGNEVSIQVYEETSGIGPGEPVEPTGFPLSVELGPGLISSIFDGIQRPLDKIREKTGDFIKRGIDIPKLDRTKKWKFTPTLDKGDIVQSGDILGEIRETELVIHKVLIPYGVSGKIVEIKSGQFTVNDIICKIEDEKSGNVVEVNLIQKWPVRKERPFKKKLPTYEPLVTGTRVIDTFFPITKGGTACIPGPFGSGKCVTGETPVFLSTGELKPIKEIYKKYKDKGKKVKNDNEEYTILNKPFYVFSYQNGKIIKSKVRVVYKGKTDKLIQIRTRTGKKIKVTPQHKLFKVEGNLTFNEVKSQDLRIGDYLVAPLYIDYKGKIQRIRVEKIFEKNRIVEKKMLDKVPLFINQLLKQYGTKKNIAKVLKIPYAVLVKYFKGKNKPTLSFVKKLFKKVSCSFEFKYIKGDTTSKSVKIPDKFDKNLAMFLGLLLADGNMKQNSVCFYNNDEKILKFFEKIVKKIFNLTGKRTIVNTVKTIIIESSILVKFLKHLGFPGYQKSRKGYINRILFRSPKKIIGAFLGAYFICDGYFNEKKGEIEYSTASYKISSGFTYLLLRLGIFNRFKEKAVNGFKQYRIFISGRDELKKFYDYCYIGNFSKFRSLKRYLLSEKLSYSNIDIVPFAPSCLRKIYELVNKPYFQLKKAGVEIFNYLSGERMSRKMFQKFANVIKIPYLQNIAYNHLNHIYFDKIVEIKEINAFCDVYDLEVPDSHNFIGGVGPMIYHNTVVLHQLAKWANADIIIYIGCGERGNEMTDVLMEFPKLKDPKSGRSLMERTVLIANTSNMPVAAREASIYTGVTIGEYFRDMGYKVAIMADSTSRWAEALREISGRLEEMPGEEGYPAYLASRVAAFYERSGRIITLGSNSREGSLSLIGAVSPPGGDLTDPVVQATLRMVKVFWSLEDRLAYQRHFPAINWIKSYSLYLDNIKGFLKEQVKEDFLKIRAEAMNILQQEETLLEIVRLIGIESISEQDRLVLEIAKSIREDFLHQHAFDPDDTYTGLKIQYRMLKCIIDFYHYCLKALDKKVNFNKLLGLKIRQKIARMKYYKTEEEFNKLEEQMKEEIISLERN